MAVKKKVAKKAVKKKAAKPKKPSQAAVIKAMKTIRGLEDQLMAIEEKIDKQMDIIDVYFG